LSAIGDRHCSKGGYTLHNWPKLEDDLRTQILTLEAEPTSKTKYGQKYQIIGSLNCPNGIILKIKTIWITIEEVTKFVTLFAA
jgi:hypothetical protein